MVLGFDLHSDTRTWFHRETHGEVHTQRMAKTARNSATEVGGKRELEQGELAILAGLSENRLFSPMLT